MCVRWYASTSMQRQALVTSWVRVAEKSVKGALNLQDLLYLVIFICIIYLQMILLWFRPLGLKYIYLLWEHHTKSIAERSYSLLRGRVFTIQISLPGAIPQELPFLYIRLSDLWRPDSYISIQRGHEKRPKLLWLDYLVGECIEEDAKNAGRALTLLCLHLSRAILFIHELED